MRAIVTTGTFTGRFLSHRRWLTRGRRAISAAVLAIWRHQPYGGHVAMPATKVADRRGHRSHSADLCCTTDSPSAVHIIACTLTPSPPLGSATPSTPNSVRRATPEYCRTPKASRLRTVKHSGKSVKGLRLGERTYFFPLFHVRRKRTLN